MGYYVYVRTGVTLYGNPVGSAPALDSYISDFATFMIAFDSSLKLTMSGAVAAAAIYSITFPGQ